MFDPAQMLIFLLAASLIALSPGPGIFYVAARTLSGGRRVGIVSSLGTGIGGLAHVFAGAAGVSALVMASAEAFTVLKLAGAAYLVYLGLKTFREARGDPGPSIAEPRHEDGAFRDGIVVEVFNPKTAAFFLAFIPQFIDALRGSVAVQFIVLGLISVGLNTLVDIGVAQTAAWVRRGIAGRAVVVRRLRQGSGLLLCGLGVSLAMARRPG